MFFTYIRFSPNHQVPLMPHTYRPFMTIWYFLKKTSWKKGLSELLFKILQNNSLLAFVFCRFLFIFIHYWPLSVGTEDANNVALQLTDANVEKVSRTFRVSLHSLLAIPNICKHKPLVLPVRLRQTKSLSILTWARCVLLFGNSAFFIGWKNNAISFPLWNATQSFFKSSLLELETVTAHDTCGCNSAFVTATCSQMRGPLLKLQAHH